MRGRRARPNVFGRMRLSGTTVLLVEDDVDNLELLAMCLEAEGALVFPASSIAGALRLAISHRVDVLVTDLDLPDGDGGALLSRLREGFGRLPGIAVSGYSLTQWRSQASTSGFDRHVVKPFRIDSLVEAIASLKGGGSDDQSAML